MITSGRGIFFFLGNFSSNKKIKKEANLLQYPNRKKQILSFHPQGPPEYIYAVFILELLHVHICIHFD